METQNNKGKGGSAFLWGLILGALIATLLTTKRGRLILREVINIALELLENFVEDREKKNQESGIKNQVTPKDIIEVTEDLESEITPNETPETVAQQAPTIEEIFEEEQVTVEEPVETKPNGNGNHKKRIFKGIRKGK